VPGVQDAPIQPWLNGPLPPGRGGAHGGEKYRGREVDDRAGAEIFHGGHVARRVKHQHDAVNEVRLGVRVEGFRVQGLGFRV
jgi:hypothetical protein